MYIVSFLFIVAPIYRYQQSVLESPERLGEVLEQHYDDFQMMVDKILHEKSMATISRHWSRHMVFLSIQPSWESEGIFSVEYLWSEDDLQRERNLRNSPLGDEDVPMSIGEIIWWAEMLEKHRLHGVFKPKYGDHVNFRVTFTGGLLYTLAEREHLSEYELVELKPNWYAFKNKFSQGFLAPPDYPWNLSFGVFLVLLCLTYLTISFVLRRKAGG